MILIFLCTIIFINFFIMYIYSYYAKKHYCNIKKTINCDNCNKIYIKLINYLKGLCHINLLLISVLPSFRVRHFLYTHVFRMKIGNNSKIRGFVEIIAPWNIEIGENSLIGQGCKLDGRNGLYIGNHVNISDGVAIWTEQHDINDANFACNDKGGKVIVEDLVWLCFRSIILPNIKIEEGAVVATGAIVTKNIEKFSLYTGIPAKKIKSRNKNLKYLLKIDSMHGY